MQIQVTEGGDIRLNTVDASTSVCRWLTKPSDGWAKRIRGRKRQPIRAIFSRYQIGVIAAEDTEDLRQKAQRAFMRRDQDGSVAALVALRTP